MSGFATKHPAGNDLPTELIEFDKKIPLIAQPGSDRRTSVPEKIREQAHDAIERDKRRDAETVKFKFVVPPSPSDKTVQLPPNFLEGALANETAKTEARREAPRRSEPARKPAANGFLNLDYDPKQKSEGSVSGPSFLGLNEDVVEEEEEEVEVSHTRRNIALLVLLALVGLGATQWQEIRDQALPFVKNGTEYIKLKVKGQPAPEPSQQANNTPGQTPNIEVAPTNQNLAQPPDQTQPATDQTASNTTSNATPGDTTGSTTKPDASTDSSTTDTTPDNTVDTKAFTKKSKTVEKETRKPKKPTAQERPQIAVEEPQGGKEELAQASATSDPAQQADWLWKSVKKGNSEASVRLAELYINGRGVTKSCDQAMVLLRSASAHNSARARGKLGAMYATGECVPQDRVQAYHWMSLALQANPSSSWTAQYRDSLWGQMTPAEKMRAGREH